jgi:hypothetical protein
MDIMGVTYSGKSPPIAGRGARRLGSWVLNPFGMNQYPLSFPAAKALIDCLYQKIDIRRDLEQARPG